MRMAVSALLHVMFVTRFHAMLCSVLMLHAMCGGGCRRRSGRRGKSQTRDERRGYYRNNHLTHDKTPQCLFAARLNRSSRGTHRPSVGDEAGPLVSFQELPICLSANPARCDERSGAANCGLSWGKSRVIEHMRQIPGFFYNP